MFIFCFTSFFLASICESVNPFFMMSSSPLLPPMTISSWHPHYKLFIILNNALIHPFLSILLIICWFLTCQCSVLSAPAWPCPIYLDSGPNLLGSYEILFFIALDFTFTTRHIHNWASFLLWFSSFILSRAVSYCSLHIPSNVLDTFWTGKSVSSSSVISFCLFILFMGFSSQEYWSGFPLSPPVHHVLLELFTVTHTSWMALDAMTHSFIELHMPLCHNMELCSMKWRCSCILISKWECLIILFHFQWAHIFTSC